MKVKIDDQVVQNYPTIAIGFLVAEVDIKESDEYVQNLKDSLYENLLAQGMDPCNFVLHPKISKWRKMYQEDFKVKPKTYRSSIEALVRRLVTKKTIWNISNVVDLYNCCSVQTLLPMGGYDLAKIQGDITFRYGKDGEEFYPLGVREKIEVKSNQLIYADESRVLCYLWNHKDSRYTSIDSETKKVIFFIDTIEEDVIACEQALKILSDHLEQISCKRVEKGVLNSHNQEHVIMNNVSLV